MLNDRVETIYKRLAPVYDLIYGATLDPGRRLAMTRLAPGSGELILEVGVGTGLSAVEYPNRCRVAAIDLSPAMLHRARIRLAVLRYLPRNADGLHRVCAKRCWLGGREFE